MADELMLEIVTPEKMAFSGYVEEVTIPGVEGEFGVLRGHEAMLSAVDIGQLNFTRNNKKVYFAVNTGYAEVTANKVTILIETAERSDQIDITRARRAKDNAEARLAKITRDNEDFEKMRAALARAIARISTAEKEPSR
ncbi:MAG TPA: F0F1 ATP synthase subunit epsilon [Smithellaceae bacterium]|nr:F0F1 ATP synthase subunit epsilon [Smithellaceae bacterium]HRS88436.1 F0F1 ATP synthase subunit epsilon [Smithellaceae bacterium]HRV25492.1 F0F1 ATP synthase subunit epsilon [Smithellaceae bacterium]